MAGEHASASERRIETQRDARIGEAVGLTQAQVSRVLVRILKDVRNVLGVDVPVA